jgi:hypothetical protein
MKTKILFMMMAAVAIIFAGCDKNDETSSNVYENENAPSYAASKKVWVFGEQVWSDAVRCPDCNKDALEDSYTAPRCRSYTSDEKTRDYYNWAYVDANKEEMCPSPWRVPTKKDFDVLVSNTASSTLIDAWGYGGYADGKSVYHLNTDANYWSSTEDSNNNAFYLYYRESGSMNVTSYKKNQGYQVRCVKDN